MRFVHAADLHIDSPLRGLVRYPGAPVERVRGATREAFRRVIDVCLAERASFLVLAGDVFDGDWKDVNTGVFFAAELSRLREVGCRALLLRGNHDGELVGTLRLPDIAHSFGVAGGDGPHSFVFEEEGIAFHGLSYGTRKVTTNLVPAYPNPRPDVLNVGVLHTNATGTARHARYAPCSVGDLVAKGYAYWALGHVHEHALLHRDPWIVYPGNTQGRSVRETGAKGCVVADHDGRRVESVRFVATDVMRYFHEHVEAEPDDDADALVARLRQRLADVAARSEGRLAAVRLEVTGSCAAHAAVAARHDELVAQVRADATDLGADLWVEKVRLATSPMTPLEELGRGTDLVAELLARTRALRGEEGSADLVKLGTVLDPLRKKLGRELAELGVELGDAGWLEGVLEEAEALLVQRLGEGGGGTDAS